ncbi:hypothetical protein LR48_Vigan09g151200 [Vigna angularis]|uniref:Uncharacterized protein n=1 Tax=Phaseolus angularis TaxID=3914 RepID=A0A0L9VCW0_PHAAN|nr:hypothetical protein LR48_Vigan09g151200 [Vigna angularis]
MAMEEEEEPKEEEGSVPTSPSSPPSSPLSEIAPPNSQRPKPLRVFGLNKLKSATSMRMAPSPPPRAPGRDWCTETGAQPPFWGAELEHTRNQLLCRWRSTPLLGSPGAT